MRFKKYYYLNEDFKPIGQPVGGIKDPDWIPVDKDHEKYLCKKCQYPLLGFGKNITSSDFINSRKGTTIMCPNCRKYNNLGNFSGYIKDDGKIDMTYFNRTTPVYKKIMSDKDD